MIGVSFHRLAFTVNTIAVLRLFVCSTCDVICKMEETIRMQILAYFVSLIYHLNKFQKFINSIMGLYTTQAKYLHNKLRINFPCPLPLSVWIIISACDASHGKRLG